MDTNIKHTHTGMSSHVLCIKVSGSGLQLCDSGFVSQLAAQVLEEFDDEDVGVGLLDAKLDKVIAKKLGKHNEINTSANTWKYETHQYHFTIHLLCVII